MWRAAEALGYSAGDMIRLLILTGLRLKEVAHATWGEIDFDARMWRIGAQRMKANRRHEIPLAAAAVGLLDALPRVSPYILTAPHRRVRGDELQPLLRRCSNDKHCPATKSPTLSEGVFAATMTGCDIAVGLRLNHRDHLDHPASNRLEERRYDRVRVASSAGQPGDVS